MVKWYVFNWWKGKPSGSIIQINSNCCISILPITYWCLNEMADHVFKKLMKQQNNIGTDTSVCVQAGCSNIKFDILYKGHTTCVTSSYKIIIVYFYIIRVLWYLTMS